MRQSPASPSPSAAALRRAASRRLGAAPLVFFLYGCPADEGEAPKAAPLRSISSSARAAEAPRAGGARPIDIRLRVSDLVRQQASGMPIVGETSPHPIHLDPGQEAVLLLSGLRLDRVVSAAAVSRFGLPAAGVRVRVHRETDLDRRSLLVLLLSAGASAQAGELALRLDTARGAVYVDPDVGRVIVGSSGTARMESLP